MSTLAALGLFSAALLFPGISPEAAQTLYNSPYVSFSPDGQAWTTNAGDREIRWYGKGQRVYTGIASSLRALETGEHYYTWSRTGTVPVGYWEVSWTEGQCIHSEYPSEETYHGMSFSRNNCFVRHYSGWRAYCADCGELLEEPLIYMSREAAESIDWLRLEDDFDYYYLCPFCDNLEQGYPMGPHACQAVSANRYRVKYEKNEESVPAYGNVMGCMESSVHMYGNAEAYEGGTVTPVTHLSPCTYSRTGYVFAGWNTAPDGSGVSYADGAEILNLTAENWDGSETDTGTVVLYAQWRPASGTLRIDPAGGSYAGNGGITQITQGYGTAYTPETALLAAPAGYRVSFAAGGGSCIGSILSGMHFSEWAAEQPFQGNFNVSLNRYRFSVPDGNVDTLRAVWEPDSVLLPEPYREGYSFGGWYYDAAFTRPAGGAGDRITPASDLTLYAQWVELVLRAEDNYAAYGGSGAVDLFWSQADGRGKTYLLWQSLNAGMADARKITEADDIGNAVSVSKEFGYTGTEETYAAPYAGIYTVSLSGAQGSGYGSLAGGKGGSISLKLWLEKGERLTVTVGGSNGYNGGGSGSLYGNGGGKTTLSSDRKGLIAVAGGGGAASSMGAGGAGGSQASLTGDGSGGSGAAGGGGGYLGGSAGELLYHAHDAAVCGYHVHTGDAVNGGGCYLTTIEHTHAAAPAEAPTYEGQTAPCHVGKYYTQAYCENCCRGNGVVNGYTHTARGCTNSRCAGVPNQDATRCNFCHGPVTYSNRDVNYYGWVLDCSKTTEYAMSCTLSEGWQCGMTESDVVSSRPAYGGSSYVNAGTVLSHEMTAGNREGNGVLTLRSESVGYTADQEMRNVRAADLAAPDAVDAGSVTQEPAGTGRITVTWKRPADNGTPWYHQAETFLQGSGTFLCRSNITENTLTSGIKGYYYRIDTDPGTAVGAGAAFLAESGETASLTADVTAYVRYLHIAAVDVAGNVGETAHVRLDAESVRWSLYTRQLRIADGGNVYAAGNGTYYVRCDGETPFLLTHEAYMDGQPTAGYQIGYTVYETAVRGYDAPGENRIYTPSASVPGAEEEITADRLSYSVGGTPVLRLAQYSVTARSDGGRTLQARQRFTLDAVMNGKVLDVTPRSGAVYQGNGEAEIHYSDAAADAGNKITLIGDCEGPVITGMEALTDREFINRGEESVTLTVTAADSLSGVAEFYLKVTNRDNFSERVFPASGGSIALDITEAEPLFSGDFTVTAYAADNVGNVTEVSREVTEFALETEIQRILEPHDPQFKRGESGILYVAVYGYADRVEIMFPDALQELDERLRGKLVFTYGEGEKEYRQEAGQQFMIPLYLPEDGEYTITVRAYKGEAVIENRPLLTVSSEGGSVLDEFRTRLR